MNSGDYLMPKEIYDELFSDYIELVQKEEQLEQELEKLKKPINYYQYASKNLKDKNEQLQQENARLKDKIEKAKKLIEVDTYTENIYLGFCYLFDNYDYEDLPTKIKDVLKKEN